MPERPNTTKRFLFAIFMHSSWQRALWLAILLSIGGLIYLPGLDGPYLYDDYSNLLDNRYLLIEALDFQSLLQASFSLQSGPLQRPVALASFAINSYLAGGFASPVSFRLINIAIHLLNGLLTYWFLRLVIERHQQVSTGFARTAAIRNKPSNHTLAAILAFFWLVHPINLTSVLYIVQRMTSLATLFTLLALISYLAGRAYITKNKSGGNWMLIGGPVACGILGVLSKENVLLLPLFILLLELLLFRQEKPWKRWRKLPARSKWLVGGAIVLFAAAVMAVAFIYALSGYDNRHFTMGERLLTEPRVLMLYLSLIVFPRLKDFGMFHDDIVLSHSLLDPLTTGLSLLAVIGLLTLAAMLFRRNPLVALGIAWFFTAHLLESTIFPLEIAHEHRNYIASMGLPMALAGIVRAETPRFGRKGWLVVLTMAGICFAAITYMRATQWSDTLSFYTIEVDHHPNSADANAGLGYFLMYRGKLAEGTELLKRAAYLKPHEPAPLINLATLSAMHGISNSKRDLVSVDDTLAKFPATSATQRAFQSCADCILTSCRPLAQHLERWLRIVLDNTQKKYGDRSIYYHFLGRSLVAQAKLNEAIEAYRMAYDLDPAYIIPLFDIAQVYLASGRPDYARTIANEIRRANQIISLPRHRELQELEKLIETAKQSSRS
jgi:hypothetical protein